MTLQEFISILQAQPFRAFRMQTRRGDFEVSYPTAASLTAQLRIAVVVDDTRVETVALDEIEHCEPFGQPMTFMEAMSAVAPETLARQAQLLATAQTLPEETKEEQPPAMDPGKVSLAGAKADDGVFVITAAVETPDGQSMFSTAGTRWNVHGVEQFENGTSLYLDHLDHPTVEQRIILWPPNTGSFESFSEALPVAALHEELRKRDGKLTAKPAKAVKPPATYFRNIMLEWKVAERDGRAEAFGEDLADMDPLRFEFVLAPRPLDGDRIILNPCLTDIMKEEILFNLVNTEWTGAGEQDKRNWRITLRHESYAGHETTLHVEVDRRGAAIDGDQRLLPLDWIERHLRNAELYEGWTLMHDALRAGPVKRNQPDAVVPLAGGFRAELWAGEPRFALPFLQPHITDAEGRTVLDLRATTWAAAVHADPKRPAVTLTLSSGERTGSREVARYPLELDLVTHQVTCGNLKGTTTIGMIQAMVRHVSGAKWMREEIPLWFAKGLSLPRPV